jgi:glycosyltransferase involved in cell wall biosynthesis
MSHSKQVSKIDLTFCVVGNMLGRNPGFVTTQGQIVADLLTDEGYQVISTSSRLNRFLRLWDIVHTIIRDRKRIDIIVLEVYSGMYFILADVASLLARVFGIPMIFVLHGGNLGVFSTRFKTWVKRVLTRADILVAPSPFIAKGLSGLGLPIRIVPNIVEIDKYPFRLRGNVQPKLLWMRAFHELYNPRMAVEALDSIRRKYPKASLVMAGVDKGLEPEIKKMVEEMGLQDAVRFPGFLAQDEKINEFSAADIFINTNHVDNMPVAVIEACAMGLPVVATCIGGIPDMIANGENGLLVPDSDAKGMADAVVSLVENSELAERFSKNGRVLAERCSWEVVRADWEELFEEIMRVKDSTASLGMRRPVSNP